MPSSPNQKIQRQESHRIGAGRALGYRRGVGQAIGGYSYSLLLKALTHSKCSYSCPILCTGLLKRNDLLNRLLISTCRGLLISTGGLIIPSALIIQCRVLMAVENRSHRTTFPDVCSPALHWQCHRPPSHPPLHPTSGLP